MEERLKFHLTLTDNETGEVIHDGDINAIIGAATNEDRTMLFGQTACGLLDLARTIAGAEKATEEIKQNGGAPRKVLELAIMMVKADRKI